ncbi:MAG: hypothetical protein ABW019_13390 [Chitinophagaceae bacterium]
MNKKVIATALILGGAAVYAIRKLTQREPKTMKAAYQRPGKHLTNVFARAKAARSHNGAPA